MGGGSWTTQAFCSYSQAKGRTTITNSLGQVSLDTAYSVQDLYKARSLDPTLSPYKVMRECRDSDEHPNTVPVIFGIDVTGSMGTATAKVAKEINVIMTQTLETTTDDVEFMVMGIGDLYCDNAPVQISQFESDIRIAEHLDKVWFEAGGGGNGYESYTAAWYMGSRHCDCDCWKRGKKGIIITIGDEPLNPYLNKYDINKHIGDNVEGDVETEALLKETLEKFDVYHLAINDKDSSYSWHAKGIKATWGKYFDEEHFKVVTLDNLAAVVNNIIKNHCSNNISSEGISW